MVDVMKVREHTTNAVILKNLAIIASEKDIASVSFANKATEFDITVKIAAKI
jgi:hypothetical protein